MLKHLLLLFILLPLSEVIIFILLHDRISLVWILLMVILTGILGANLAKQQGLQTWRSLQMALEQGRLPDQEALDAALILVAGAVLLTPGFLTDALGFFLLYPATRQVVKPSLLRWMKGRIQVSAQKFESSHTTTGSMKQTKGRVVNES